MRNLLKKILNKKILTLLVIFILIVTLFNQTNKISELKTKNDEKEQKILFSIQYVIKNIDYQPLVINLEKMADPNFKDYQNGLSLMNETRELTQSMEEDLDVLTRLLDNSYEVPHFFGYFYSLKPKYLYFKEFQSKDKDQFKRLAKEIDAIDKLMKQIKPDQFSQPMEQNLPWIKRNFMMAKPHFDEINQILSKASGRSQKMNVKITENEAINNAKELISIPKDYNPKITLDNGYVMGRYQPVYTIHFLNESNPRGQIVIDVNGENGQIISVYNEMIMTMTKDEYIGKSIDEEMKRSMEEIALKATEHLPGNKIVVIPEIKHYNPQKHKVWVISEANGISDFSRYASLSINLTAKEVTHYTQHWPNQTLDHVTPKLTVKEVMQEIRKDYYIEPEMGKLIIAYSSYLNKPVLSYVFRDFYKKGSYHLVNANTGRVEFPLYILDNDNTINNLLIQQSFHAQD